MVESLPVGLPAPQRFRQDTRHEFRVLQFLVPRWQEHASYMRSRGTLTHRHQSSRRVEHFPSNMATLPAFCEQCHAAFPSPFQFTAASAVTFRKVEVDRCRKCGGRAWVPDGIYNFAGETIEVLSAPQRTIEELRRLEELLKDARARDQSPQQTADLIRAELPQLSKLADALPKTRPELYAFLALILATLTYLKSDKREADRDHAPAIVIERVINQVYLNAGRDQVVNEGVNVQSGGPERNDPCPCGSGKKYKRCCLLKK